MAPISRPNASYLSLSIIRPSVCGPVRPVFTVELLEWPETSRVARNFGAPGGPAPRRPSRACRTNSRQNPVRPALQGGGREGSTRPLGCPHTSQWCHSRFRLLDQLAEQCMVDVRQVRPKLVDHLAGFEHFVSELVPC